MVVGEDEALPGESTREQSRTNTIPKVSVVIPCYNGSAYLEECLQSIAALADPDWEVLVVDDGSTENIREVVDRFSPLARYLWQPNQGPAAARNTGLQQARGRYVRFLDSDDYLTSQEGLHKQIAVLDEHPEVGLVYGQATKVDPSGRPFAVRKPKFTHGSYIRPGEVELQHLLFGNYMTTSSIVVRRSILEHVGFFRTDLFSGEDWDRWLRIAQVSSVAYVAEPIAAYRVHGKSITANYSLTPWLRTHYDILDSIYSDPQFAARYARLRELVHVHLYEQAANLAYTERQMSAARSYIAKARRHYRVEREWSQVARCYLLMAKTYVPAPILPTLRRASRASRQFMQRHRSSHPEMGATLRR